MKAADAIGIGSHVSIKEFADSIEPLVTVAYPPNAVQSRIRLSLLLDAQQLKIVLAELARLARRA